MRHEEAEEIARRFVAAITAGDIDALDGIVSSHYVQHNPGTPPGRDGLKQYFRPVVEAFPGGVARVESVIVEGDLMVGRFSHRGAQRSTFLDIPASGRAV